MPDFDSQNTDRENAKPLVTSSARDDDVKTLMSKSAQEIARDRANQNTVAGSGGENPGASIK